MGRRTSQFNGCNFIMDWLNITLFLSMILVVLILAWGLITMARGGDYNKSHSNILMRYRIIFQAIAILILKNSNYLQEKKLFKIDLT